MPRSFFSTACRTLLPAAALAVAACGVLSDGTPQSPAPVEPLLLEINNARGMEYVNRELLVTVRTEGGVPDTVELLQDGRLLATLRSPFQFTWDTTGVEEGVHELQARARWKGHEFTSQKHPVSVDRTGPSVLEVFPSGNNLSVHDARRLRVTFTEPIRIMDLAGLSADYRNETFSATTRLSVSDDGRSVSASVISLAQPPFTGDASVPLEGITDLAGNSARFNPYAGPRYSWDWAVPAFRRTSAFSLTHAGVPVQAVGRPALAVEPGGAVVVAVVDSDSAGLPVEVQEDGMRIVVGRLDGEAWSAVGPAVSMPGAPEGARVSRPRVVLDAAGHPVVAFQYRSSADSRATLHVFRWAAPSWQPLGGPLNAPEEAELHGSALVADGEGRPVVAWSAADGVRVRRWESDRWVPLGDVQRAGTEPGAKVSADAPGLSAGRAGGVFVAWAEASSEGTGAGLYVRSWNGSRWEAMGGRLAYGPDDVLRKQVTESALAAAPGGMPVAVWAERDERGNHDEVVVARWSGTDWELSPVPSMGLPSDEKSRRWPAAAVDGHGRVLVTCIGGRTPVGLHASWYTRYGQSVDKVWAGSQNASSLALDAEGKPVIAWTSFSNLLVARPNE